MTIQWNFPEPRFGVLGLWDRFVGPGATRAEVVLQVTLPTIAVAMALLSSVYRGLSWTPMQMVFVGIFAFDLAGGVVTNATSTAKRWYHRAGQGPKAHMTFVLLHLLHLVIVAWMYLGGAMLWVAMAGAYLVVAAGLIVIVSTHLQRPVAYAVYGGALLLSMYGLQAPAGLEWFLPVFYFKLLVSHLPKEEPYRPTKVSCVIGKTSISNGPG